MNESFRIVQAVVLCGGKGTRLGELTRDIPKPLLPIAGEVLLDRTLRLLAVAGVQRVLLLAGHLGEQIEDHYCEGEFAGMQVEVFCEPKPLGTAGALPLVAEKLDESFLLIYGDVFLDFDIALLGRRHEMMRNCGAVATLLSRPSDHPWDSHLLDVDEDGWVREFIFEQKPGLLYKNCGNVAIYACERKLLDFIPHGRASDFGRDVFPAVLAAGEKLATCELEIGGFVRDMGTPERLLVVEAYLKRRDLAEAARQNPKSLRVAFLDRDGTLNVDKGLIYDPDELELIDGAAEAVAKLNEEGWICFVLTNQPVLARGLCSEEELVRIHQHLENLLAQRGARVEKIYYSPYHPETHYGEGVRELRRASDCRKPNAGMLFAAQEEFHLDLAECVMIGDSWRDVMAGQGAGVRTVFLGTEGEEGAGLADWVYPDLAFAVTRLLAQK